MLLDGELFSPWLILYYAKKTSEKLELLMLLDIANQLSQKFQIGHKIFVIRNDFKLGKVQSLFVPCFDDYSIKVKVKNTWSNIELLPLFMDPCLLITHIAIEDQMIESRMIESRKLTFDDLI